MLTRLRIDGFKNLMDVDVRFGPFTCIAGANGVGKSNLFDAILFLSALADKSLTEAALSVRNSGELGGDPLGVFFGGGELPEQRIRLAAELILPPVAVDHLGQDARAATTFVEYELVLGIRAAERGRPNAIEIVSESLRPIKLGDAVSRLRFPHKLRWRKSVLTGRKASPLISTVSVDGATRIKRHQDGNTGRAAELATSSLPRTVLSSATASESPTALVAKREMMSWQLLQLEPSLLREPSEYYAPEHLDSTGRHLPALLYRLDRTDLPDEQGATLANLATRLSELVRETRDLEIDRDDARQQTTLYLHDASGGRYPARALSDGTLRFLALLALDLDPEASSLLCLEEPENGIHPERIPRILSLLAEMPTDAIDATTEANPLRQVIINTHSPLVVAGTSVDDLVVVGLKPAVHAGEVVKLPRFMAGADTWRASAGATVISARELKRYIGAQPKPQRKPPSGDKPPTVEEKYGVLSLFAVDA